MTEHWEIAFDEKFHNNIYVSVPTDMDVKVADMKDFIRTLLREEQEKHQAVVKAIIKRVNEAALLPKNEKENE